ncbi:Mov34/MPN/PAD-1 family protein [Paludisphaera rhizosphaerae]|uniref:Mov34/MPN/PAD-1 family protein n=1 Tax=Paludisphaera rhizosphaerae TaxID=2711216 RepID=UPI0013ECB227|nr:Mov34/MPN/PAD-1 family protein [Paludisphaera rhizosphaerae]
MSQDGGDEMVFGEVRFREPAKMRRPDRDPRLACVACQTPGPGDLPVFLDLAPADAIERHALSDTTVELGGVLLGKECVDPTDGAPFVWITQALEAKHYANTQASFTYTHDSWEEITRERDRLHPDLDVVGWYHTHPNFGIFLSHHDLFIHKNFFDQPLQTAYVVDPIQGTRGFFQWSDGGMVQVGGFHLCAERHERAALSRLADQLENLPGSPAGGIGASLSPRLEAELIKMLNRPAPSRVAPGDGLALAAFLGFLGTMGLLMLAGLGLWLHYVDTRLSEQSHALTVLAREVEESSAGRRAAHDLMLEKIGDANPETFLARFEKLAQARDEARKQLADQRSATEVLGARLKELSEKAGGLEAELAATLKSREVFESEAKEAPKLRDEVEELKQALDDDKRELTDQRAILKSAEGEQAAKTYKDLKFYTLTTWIGALTSALLAVTAVWLYVRPQLSTSVDNADAARRAL